MSVRTQRAVYVRGFSLAAVALATSAVAWTVWPAVAVARAERQLKRLYEETAPSAFRIEGQRLIHSERRRLARPDELRWVVNSLLWAESRQGTTPASSALLARAAHIEGAHDRAVELYRRALSLAPSRSQIRMELAGALLARYRRFGRVMDLPQALEEAGRATRFEPQTAWARYNLAVLFEAAEMPEAALAEWERVVQEEIDAGWKQDAEERRRQRAAESTARRTCYDSQFRGAGAFAEAARQHVCSDEIALEAAVVKWLAEAGPPSRVLHEMAGRLRTSHGDVWLTDMLRNPPTPQVAAALAEAALSNQAGEHENAIVAARRALRLLGAQPSPAAFRARFEEVLGLHRTESADVCLTGARALWDDLQQTRYTWLRAQAWLERTTCEWMTGSSGRLVSEPEAAIEFIARSGYKGLELRARGFLVQPELVRGNPVRLWRLSIDGLRTYRRGSYVPARAQQFSFGAALGSGSLFPHAGVAMAREGLLAIRSVPNQRWLALLLENLSTLEAAAGLQRAASVSARESERAFAAAGADPGVRRYQFMAALLRAEMDIGQTPAADLLMRVKNLEPLLPRVDSYRDHARLNAVIGTACLRAGRLTEAADRFRGTIDRATAELAITSDRPQRDALLRELQRALKGDVEVRLRQGDARGAFDAWNRHRLLRWRVRTDALRLPSSAVLLGVEALPGGVVLFAHDGTAMDARWLPGMNSAVEAAARAFIDASSSPLTDFRDLDRTGRRLSTLLLAPVRERLKGKSMLIIRADGVLNAVPWMAVPSPDGGLLADRYSIALGDGYRGAGLARGGDARPFVIANPTLPGEFQSMFPPLPETLQEAAAIARQFPNAILRTGNGATAEALKGFLPQSAFFHFGGHGIPWTGDGTLLLAGATADREPSYVGASELGKLDLQNLQLATLAACSTAAGERAGPVNPESVVRALIDAGVWNVVASLWNLDSSAAGRLTVLFYSALRQNGDAGLALREACNRVRRQPHHRHPFYWAGIQLYTSPKQEN